MILTALKERDKEEEEARKKDADANAEALVVVPPLSAQNGGSKPRKPPASGALPSVPTAQLLADLDPDVASAVCEIQSFFTGRTEEHEVSFPKGSHCHLCHKFCKSTCLKFSPDCNHAYCDRHVNLKFGRTVESMMSSGKR